MVLFLELWRAGATLSLRRAGFSLRGLLVAAEQGVWGVWASGVAARGLESWLLGSRAQAP